MKKRIISMLLAGVMTVGLLTGCGSKDDKGASAPAESKVEESKDETKEETPASEEEVSGETVTVKWLVPGDKPKDYDLVMEDVNKKMVEKINVALEIEYIPQGEFNDKAKLASTAGEDFDLIFTANWLNKFDENMSRDAFMPITDLLNEYGQGIVESMPDWLLDVAKVNGDYYAVPNQQIIARQYGVSIQKEYVDKYNLKTDPIQDFHELDGFFDELAANESDMFIIDLRQFSEVLNKYEWLANGFVGADTKDGTLIKSTEIMADQFRMDKDMYDRGWVRKDIATVVDNSDDVKANRYITNLSTWKPGGDAEYSQRQGVEYVSIPVGDAFVGAVSGLETMTAFNVNSKNPEAAMKALNLVYTDKEIYNELLFGIEGTHYNKVGENRIETIGDASESTYYMGAYGWKLGNQFNAYLQPGQEDGVWEATDELNKTAVVSPLRGFVFNPENVQAELAQLAAVDKEFKNGSFVADDIEKYISDYTEKMEQAGLQTVYDEVVKQVEEWKASK